MCAAAPRRTAPRADGAAPRLATVLTLQNGGSPFCSVSLRQCKHACSAADLIVDGPTLAFLDEQIETYALQTRQRKKEGASMTRYIEKELGQHPEVRAAWRRSPINWWPCYVELAVSCMCAPRSLVAAHSAGGARARA